MHMILADYPRDDFDIFRITKENTKALGLKSIVFTSDQQ